MIGMRWLILRPCLGVSNGPVLGLLVLSARLSQTVPLFHIGLVCSRPPAAAGRIKRSQRLGLFGSQERDPSGRHNFFNLFCVHTTSIARLTFCPTDTTPTTPVEWPCPLHVKEDRAPGPGVLGAAASQAAANVSSSAVAARRGPGDPDLSEV